MEIVLAHIKHANGVYALVSNVCSYVNRSKNIHTLLQRLLLIFTLYCKGIYFDGS